MAPSTKAFRTLVYDYYKQHGRHDMPWRLPETDGSFDPYKILVSEIMLQQTQVSRVIPKYDAFIEQYPTILQLAQSPLRAVLQQWVGLGYNRRAQYLHQTAQAVATKHNGIFPRDRGQLVAFPGIGPNTAGALLAYAYNAPVTFIETNIRTIYIHHYFNDAQKVTDSELMPIISRTLDKTQPREWYWALMDYGNYLKQSVGNRSQASAHYTKQSSFEGSVRQIRGAVIRELTNKTATIVELQKILPDNRLRDVLAKLESEQLIYRDNETYRL
jgi:A/G-specific adenine glycosylase